MPGFLVVEDNEQTLSFSCEQIITLGRDKNNDIVLDDLKASRNHAMVRCLGHDNYYLIDGGSSNGTFLNAKRIALPSLLKDGDVITLGSSNISFSQVAHDSADDFDEDMAQTVMIKPSVEVTKFVILVSDIRGFTTIAESIPIEILTEIMNEWFHAVRKCINRQGGIIDKFLGDCVYARWETGDNLAEVVAKALTAAAELNVISGDLNAEYEEELNDAGHQLNIGVGINTGIAALGVEQSFSAIGDAVNLAFRLESATREIGKDVVLGKEAYKYIPEKLWQGKEQVIKVKGKTGEVDICGYSFEEVQSFLKDLP